MLWKPYPLTSVTMLGCGPTGEEWGSQEPKEGHEVWTVNDGFEAFFPHDVVFDMHTREYLEQKNYAPALHRREKMREHDKPIVMARRDPRIPSSRTYPLGEVMRAFGSAWFDNAVPYMIAFALLCGVKEIDFWGMDFSKPDHSDGHLCSAYWIGRAEERGVSINVSNNSNFLNTAKRADGRLYGYL